MEILCAVINIYNESTNEKIRKLCQLNMQNKNKYNLDESQFLI